jgi:phosphoglucomutase
MALYLKSIGKTLMQRLNEIYEKYGYFEEMLFSKYFEGEKGFDIMQSIMNKLKEAPPLEWAGKKTVLFKNYNDGTTKNISSGNKEKNIDLPSSNVLQFVLEDDTVISVRPSGTEPKIKFYASCRSKPGITLNTAKTEVGAMIAGIRESISGLV